MSIISQLSTFSRYTLTHCKHSTCIPIDLPLLKSCGTISFCFYSQKTWYNLEHAIVGINHDRYFSLKEGGMWRVTVHHRIILKQLNLNRSSEEL